MFQVRDLHDDDGQLSGIAVDNLLLGRWRCCRIVRDVPEVAMLKWPRRWARNDEVFGEFVLDGAHFSIVDLFDSSDRYFITSEPPVPAATLQTLKAAFRSAPLIDWRFGSSG